MFALPAGQLSFLLRAGVDCLPSPVNLQRWRIQTDPKYPLCYSKPCTTNHILNYCTAALSQGRYTWRHDSILSHLVKALQRHLSANASLYADLPGYRYSDSPLATVPSSLVVTTARPDIVIVKDDEVRMLELTICINTQSGFENSRVRKQSKSNYIALANDLEACGYSADLVTLEVGSLGHFTKDAINSLRSTAPAISKVGANCILLEIAKIAIICSFQLFQARQCVSWNCSKSLI